MNWGPIPGVNIALNTASRGYRSGETALSGHACRTPEHCAQHATVGFRGLGAATPTTALPGRGRFRSSAGSGDDFGIREAEPGEVVPQLVRRSRPGRAVAFAEVAGRVVRGD